jgi:hypothetical protein
MATEAPRRLPQLLGHRQSGLLAARDLIDAAAVEESQPTRSRCQYHVVHCARYGQFNEPASVCPRQRVTADVELLLDDLPS